MGLEEFDSNDPRIKFLLERIAELDELMGTTEPGTQVYNAYKALKEAQGQFLIQRINENLGKQMPLLKDRVLPGNYETVAKMMRKDRDAANKKFLELRTELSEKLRDSWYKTLHETYRLPPRKYHLKKLVMSLTEMVGGAAAGGSAIVGGGEGVLGTLFLITIYFGTARSPAGSASAQSRPTDPRLPRYHSYLLNWLNRTWREITNSRTPKINNLPFDFDDWVKHGCPQ